VWADPAQGGGPPSNWLDPTGQSAWQWDDRTGQYYLHNYLPEQADLNWWEPAVHAEFGQILTFWFERGIAGFRIDVAHGLYKDALLRDNPVSLDDGPLGGRFGFSPTYSANRPETHAVYREWRRIAERYAPPKLLLGETWTGDFSELSRFYGDDDELQLAFNFPFVFSEFSAPALSGVVTQTLADLPAGACPVWTASNHDVGRFATRWCGDDPRKIRLALLVLATLPGTAVLYYGDELGMTDVAVPPQEQRDRMSPPDPASSRDRGRTPMRWDATDGAGFTSPQVRPWLPLGDTPGGDVAGQMHDPDSTLSFCRRLIAWRRAEFGGGVAGYELLSSAADFWSYSVGEVTVLANFSGQRRPAAPPGGQFLLASWGTQPPAGDLVIEPWQGLVYRTS
jgi:alpha-glucosidase